jgi:hypothetical protein
MTTQAEWGPGERPPPSEPKAAPFAVLFGALSLAVSGLALAAAVVSTIGMAVVGEPYEGSDLGSAVTFGGFGAVVLAIGWRAYRRDDPGAGAGAAILARLAPVLGGAGLLLGIAAGVWMTVVGLDAMISSDRNACARFTGPLEPTDREACRSVARECRHEVGSGPVPALPRGVQSGADAPPEGVEMPLSAKAHAITTCMLERRGEFVR